MLTHLYELVRQRAERHPRAIAIGGAQGLAWKTLDSRALLDLVDRAAVELAAAGIREGDRVVTWLPGGWRTPVYLFALWRLGAIVVPFDREMNPRAAADIVASVEARCILAGYGERPGWAEGARLLEWWEPGTRGGAPGGAWTRPAEELAVIAFTSGTTGAPKGCMISHANLCSQVETLGHNIPLGPDCRLASILPLSHLFELTAGLLYALSTGAAIHYVPSRRAPDILMVLTEQRITHMIAVPQLLILMGNALDEQLRAALPAPLYRAAHGLAARLPLRARRLLFFPVHRKLGGALRMLASGGAALPPETHRLWERLGVRVVEGYGASECSPVVACGEPDGSTPIGSVGRPIRGVTVRLAADDELLVRGPNVMRGYWRDPVRTAEVLRDGWYHSGDLARLDATGNIFLQGRARDLIALPSGLKVWPQDVEEALRALPGVKDAAVIPVPAAGGGATLHAYLLPAGGAPDPGALVARANAHLALHQRIATASWWPEPDFPRTPTLKVKRALLPLPIAAETRRVAASPAALDAVGQAVAAVARTTAVRDDQTLAELGLDSLGLVELALALEEKTGVALGERDLAPELTVADVRARIAAAGEAASERTADAEARETTAATQPLWPYTRGRVFRALAAPFDLLQRLAAIRTVVLGAEHLRGLPPRLILAGTHHSYADLPTLRAGLRRAGARGLAGRLVIAASAGNFAATGLLGRFGILAFGIYPLRQYRGQAASLRGLLKVAEAGNAILIFPQGHHTDPALERAHDPRAAFKTGAAHLALALDAAVLPFGLAGTERLLPTEPAPGTPTIAGIPLALRRVPVAVAFGAPLRPAPGETPDEFTARLQAACFALTRRAEASLGAGRPRAAAGAGHTPSG